MAVDLGPRLGQLINADIGEFYADQFRPFLRTIDELLMCAVINSTTNVPPPFPSNGDAYLLLGSPEFVWGGQHNSIAIWSTEITEDGNNVKTPGWDFKVPNDGWLCWDTAEAVFWVFTDGNWVKFQFPGGTGVAGFLPIWETTTTLGDSPVDYNVTDAGYLTIPVSVNAIGVSSDFAIAGATFEASESGTIDLTSGGAMTLSSTGGMTLSNSSSSTGLNINNSGTQAMGLTSSTGGLNLISGGLLLLDGEKTEVFGTFSLSGATITTTPYAVGSGTETYGLYNATTAPIVANLPAASSVALGTMFSCKKIDASGNSVTITPHAGDTVEGASTYALTARYKYINLVSDHVNTWYNFGSN